MKRKQLEEIKKIQEQEEEQKRKEEESKMINLINNLINSLKLKANKEK